jgi:hypothetical protein
MISEMFLQNLPSFNDPNLCAPLSKYTTRYFGQRFSDDVDAAVESFNTCQGHGKVNYSII